MSALLERLSKSELPERRFVGLYLQDELREPSFPRSSPELAHAGVVALPGGVTSDWTEAIRGSTGVTLVVPEDPVDSELPPMVASVWRAILRLTYQNDTWGNRWDVVASGHTVTLERRPRDRYGDAWENPDAVAGMSDVAKRTIRWKEGYGPFRDKRRGLRVLAQMEGCELHESPTGELSFEKRGK